MKRSYDKLNPRMASTPGFEPGPHWWEARALTTAAPLLLHAGKSVVASPNIGCFLRPFDLELLPKGN